MIIHDKLLNVTKKQIRNLNFFWFGFILYTISYTFSRTDHLNYIVCQALQTLGLIFIFYNANYLIRFKFANKYLQIVFIIYCLWLLFIILRGFSFNYVFLKNILFDASYGMMPYFAPLILLFPKNISFYKKVFDVIISIGIFYIIFDVAFIKDLLNPDYTNVMSREIVEFSALLSIPVCFLLLTYNYHSYNRKIFSVIIILLTLFFAIFRARRGLTFICLSQIVSSYLLHLINSKKKFLMIVYTIFILLIGISYIYDTVQKEDNTIFSSLIERGDEDTRTGVELSLYSDFNTKDWIFGRGIQGEYYCPDIVPNQLTDNRQVIETGYLQIILRGGLISLALILLITLPAIFLGLFYSKNTLSKAAGLWILLWALYLYPTTMEGFSLYYILFWISIGICYSKAMRNIPESALVKIFSNR